MIVTDILLAIPIGIIYNIIAYQISDIVNNNLIYEDKIQRNLIFNFFAGLIAICIGHYIFKKNKKLRNRSIRLGLYFGAIILFFNLLVYNWNLMSAIVKIIIFIVLLSILIFTAYRITK